MLSLIAAPQIFLRWSVIVRQNINEIISGKDLLGYRTVFERKIGFALAFSWQNHIFMLLLLQICEIER